MASVINQIKLGNVEYAIAASAYAECSTAAGTAEKVATICTDGDTTNTAFTLIKGVSIQVKFTTTNSAASPKLKVNGTTACPIFYKGAAISASYLKANYIYTFVYDGTNWNLVGEIDTNSDNDKKTSSTNTSSKIFLVGATSQSSSGQTTYSHDTAYVGTDGCLYSNSTKVSVEGHSHSSYVHIDDFDILDKEVYDLEESLATVAKTGSYTDLTNKPTIPSVSNATITIKQTGKSDQTFTLNGGATTISLNDSNTTYSAATTSANGLMSSTDKSKLDGIATGATKVTTDTVSGWGYTKNAGTVTQVKVGTTAYSPSSGVVSLPAYPSVPTSLKNPNSLTIKANSDSAGLVVYDGSAAKTFIIKPSTTAGAFIISDGTTEKTIQLAGKFTDNNTTYSVATTSANGLMSKTDKSNLDALVAAWTADGTNDTLINKIQEVLTAFENAPEGTNIVTALAAKADKSSLATVATSGSYNDLSNKPTIPTVNNATLTIQKNGTTIDTFTANSSTNKTVNITVPTGAAASKGVDTSISAGSTSTNLPTSKAVAAFVEGKGYKTTDNNTTYTIATGDSNGQIKVTPSSGSAYNVSVKGLGSAAYTNSSAYAAASHGTHVTFGGNGTATTVSRSDHTHEEVEYAVNASYADEAKYAVDAGYATKAAKDSAGNVINTTYATKTELAGKANSSHGTHVTADTVKSALGTSSTGTGFLKQDGTWATPTNTTYSLVGANGTTGLVKNGSSVTSTSGLTACPIISGVPYYKDTNTQSAYGNITTSGTITSTAVTSATGVLVYDSNNKIQRATAAQTRAIIGAGTSNLTLGTTATTAAKGNHTHDYSSTYAAKSHGNHVPATETANNAKFLRNDNTWQTVTPANIGAISSVTAAAGSNINSVGTPTVTASTSNGVTTLTFNNLKGATGSNGKNGTNGTSAAWFTGTAVTGTSTSATRFTVSGSKAGDMYLNTSTYNVYRASAASKWIYVCNIKGATGAAGSNATVTKSAVESVLTGNITSHTHSYAASSHNQASSTINAMTGYSKPSSTSAISTSDSLNSAIGKLEKALDGKTANKGTVTSVRVQAGTGLSSSTSTAQTSSLNTTISIASGYKLPTTTEWNDVVTKANSSGSSDTWQLHWSGYAATAPIKLWADNIIIAEYAGTYYTFNLLGDLVTQGATTGVRLNPLAASNSNASLGYVPATVTRTSGNYTITVSGSWRIVKVFAQADGDLWIKE